MAGALVGLVYGVLLVVALSNWLLMRRPRGSAPCCFEVMVPARDESLRLPLLIPPLVQAGCPVTVYDDGSQDGTASVAADLGARAVVGTEELPDGWRGKTHACHRLSELAQAEWVVFLDADTVPTAEFVAALSAFLESRPARIQVVTGFPKMLPGRGLEPGYLFWVPWILLATNPFGLVARTGRGHNMFLNGQVTAWRRDTLGRVRPFEQVKGEVLDDVMMGRLLSRLRIGVEVANLSQILAVRMYETVEEARQGMAKNSADVVPGRYGYVVFSLLLLALGVSWIARPILFGPGLLAALAVNAVVRMPLWAPLFWPISAIAGAVTALQSGLARQSGRRTWKGRPV